MSIDYDSIAESYAANRKLHPAVLAALLDLIHREDLLRVLEIGCGTANYIAAIQRETACTCWGIDPSENMLSAATKHEATLSLRIGSAEQLDFSADSFDLVYSIDVVHHLDDRSAYFREAYRVLGNGGYVCTVTDSSEIIGSRRPLSVYFPATISVELKRYPRIFELETIMVEAGFHGLSKEQVELAYDLTDLSPFEQKAFSCLHLIPSELFDEGIRKMAEDLKSGPIHCVSRYLLLHGRK